MEEIVNYVRKCGCFYIATIDGDKPRVRPFGVMEIFDGHLYIMTGKVKNVSKQIQINPNVEICCSTGETWMRLSGKLVNDDRYEAKSFILDTNPQLKEMYSATDDNMEVLYFENGEAIFSSFVSEPKIIKF